VINLEYSKNCQEGLVVEVGQKVKSQSEIRVVCRALLTVMAVEAMLRCLDTVLLSSKDTLGGRYYLRG
jgi:hypothetical protein